MTSPRSFDTAIELPASPEEVWRALTDPEELVRWFPLQAEVRPGVGGEIRWAWGERFDWATRIAAWEPGQRLLLTQASSVPFDLAGRPIADGSAPPATIALEFTLAKSGGGCRLRVVHSGFGLGAAWDDELEGISHGWQGELRSLRHYLTRHHGQDRHVGWAFRTLPPSASTAPAQALARLTSADAFAIEVTTLAPGLPWAVRTPWGETLRGEVALALPTGEIAGSIRELGGGFLRLHAWRAGGSTAVGVWLATWWGGHRDTVREFERRAGEALERLFP
jgi:uncharacterized protein YndB with AHSA1/START domain